MQVLGKVPIIEIDETEFTALQAAHQALSAGLAIEEKHEILISSYLGLEKDLE
jgi:hypothetical protein